MVEARDLPETHYKFARLPKLLPSSASSISPRTVSAGPARCG